MTLNLYKQLLYLVAIILFLPISAKAGSDVVIDIASTKNAIHKYQLLSDAEKAVPLSIKTLSPEINSPCIASLMIIKNALKLGGINARFNFIEVPNIRRESDAVAKGQAVSGSHMFHESMLNIPGYQNSIFTSTPIIKAGESQKGIYCLPENTKLLNVTSLEELKLAGKPLIGLHWNNDVRILNSIGITNIEKGPTTNCLFKMIKAGRADWIPLGFHNTKGMAITRHGITLVPVQGIKLMLYESRHILISKKHPDGKKVYEALQKGIKIMQESGIMDKMLVQGGYTCEKTRNWKILNTHRVAVHHDQTAINKSLSK